MDVVATVADAGGGLGLTLVATVALAGFRHGFDVDHVAAITDIASATPRRRAAFVLATTYALGHMAVVSVLGLLAVLAGDSFPASWDALAGKAIGLSLIWLGLYVAYSIVRHRQDFRMRSRWMLLVGGARRGLSWLKPATHVVVEHEHEHPADGHHDHAHDQPGGRIGPTGRQYAAVATQTTTHTHAHTHVVPMPPDPFTEYNRKTSFVIGMLHGVGAETPTQMLLFTTAAGLSGATEAIALVALFVAALLVGNTVLAIAAVAGASMGEKVPFLHLTFGWIAAVASISVGTLYLFE